MYSYFALHSRAEIFHRLRHDLHYEYDIKKFAHHILIPGTAEGRKNFRVAIFHIIYGRRARVRLHSLCTYIERARVLTNFFVQQRVLHGERI